MRIKKIKEEEVDVLNLSRFIINWCNLQQPLVPINLLKLETLLGVVQVYSYKKFNKPCFPQKVIIDGSRPRVYEVESEFIHYTGNHIPIISSFITWDGDDIWTMKKEYYTDDIIPKSVQEYVKEVLNAVARIPRNKLDEIVRNYFNMD